MDRDDHVILFPAIFFFGVCRFQIEGVGFYVHEKTLPYPLKDLILQYHAVSFRVVNERIDEITEDGLSVKTVKMNVHLSDGRELCVSSPFWLFACRLPFACKLSA